MELNKFYSNKKVLVTGHTGFKGSWISTWLLMLGEKVYGNSKGNIKAPAMYEICKLGQHVENYQGDILDSELLSNVIDKIEPDIIFHFAGQAITTYAYAEPLKTFETNIIGTASMLEAFRNLDASCIMVSITSDKSYFNKEWIWGYKETDEIGGKDPYSASKSGAEIVLQSYYHTYFKNSEVKKMAVARAGNIIGGGDWALDRIVPDCVKSWHSNQSVIIRNPSSIRPWQHVLDTVYGYLLLPLNLSFNSEVSGEAFNFGPNPISSYTVLQLVNQMKNKLQERGVNTPVSVETSNNSFEAKILKLNSEKAHAYLGWKPSLSIEEAINMTSEWYYHCMWKQAEMLSFTEEQIKYYNQKIGVN